MVCNKVIVPRRVCGPLNTDGAVLKYCRLEICAEYFFLFIDRVGLVWMVSNVCGEIFDK